MPFVQAACSVPRPTNLPISMADINQKPYVRAREDPYFNGIRRGDMILMDQDSDLDLHKHVRNTNISRFPSDVSDISRENVLSKVSRNSSIDLDSKITREPYRLSSSGKWSMIDKTTPFESPAIQLDLGPGVDDYDSAAVHSPGVDESNKMSYALSTLVKPSFEGSVNEKKPNYNGISLPQSAAAFYNGFTPLFEIEETCESINRLNLYLKATRADVNAGVPGRFLHAVIGQGASDVGCVASTIMYAFYLNKTMNSDQLCTVPIINMNREDLNAHAELKWLLNSCRIDQSLLIFVGEIDLSYYDLFGSLKLVLLNGHKLPTKLEALKDAVVEIFHFRKEGSSCALVAEKFAMNLPEVLAGRGFSRLLLSGILFDSENLTGPQCTLKDKYMATLLIKGAGRYGCDGLYELLRYKMYDLSDLKMGDILRKEFKKLSRVGKVDSSGSRIMMPQIGMSSIGVSIEELIAHEEQSLQNIVQFQYSERLRVLVVVSGYYDHKKNFKREILVSAESVELMKGLLHFFHSNVSVLPFKVLHNISLGHAMKAFEIDQITSRKIIEQLLEDFSGMLK